MDPETKQRMTDRTLWKRGLYMVFYFIALAVARITMTLVVVFQFVAALFTGSVNDALHRFGHNLSTYVYQILQFVTFNSETLPFPFSDWPDETPTDMTWVESADSQDRFEEAPSATTQTATQGETDTQDTAAEVATSPATAQADDQPSQQDNDVEEDSTSSNNDNEPPPRSF